MKWRTPFVLAAFLVALVTPPSASHATIVQTSCLRTSGGDGDNVDFGSGTHAWEP
jgi:hypothetical protein